MKTKVCVPLETLSDNLLSCLRRDLPYVDIGKLRPEKVAVVAGGPSMQDYLEDIREWDGYVIAINGAHDWLIEEGIIPDAVIAIDPQPALAKCFQKPNDETTYLIASCCAPEVFDALEGRRVIVWHAIQGECRPLGVSHFVLGGPSAATRAPHLLYMMGFREVHMFGVDSSYDTLQTHVYENGHVNGGNIQVRVGMEMFITTPPMLAQAEYLWNTTKDFNIKIHGYGLSAAMIDNEGDYEVI